MFAGLTHLADSSSPPIALTPEAIFKVGGVTITNAMLYGVICAFALLFIMFKARRQIGVRANKGIGQFIEIAVEFVVGLIENPLGSRKKAVKYAPIFATIFIFIVFNYLMGIIPLAGPGLYATTHEGRIPLLRSFTSDLNATLGMAIFAILIVQYLSIKESGVLGHLKHYFTNKPLNPINFFIGVLEVFGEFTRIISLSLRLFLNTAVGDILIAVFAWIGKDFQSITILPIALFEILVALIQAYVFTMLCATYLGLAIAHGAHDDEHPTHEVDPIVANLEGDVSH